MRIEPRSDTIVGVIDVNTTGDVTLIPAQDYKWIFVHHISGSRSATTITVKFKEYDPLTLTSTDITPFYQYDAFALESTLPDGSVYFRVRPGRSLVMEKVGAGLITGTITYSFRG